VFSLFCVLGVCVCKNDDHCFLVFSYLWSPNSRERECEREWSRISSYQLLMITRMFYRFVRVRVHEYVNRYDLRSIVTFILSQCTCVLHVPCDSSCDIIGSTRFARVPIWIQSLQVEYMCIHIVSYYLCISVGRPISINSVCIEKSWKPWHGVTSSSVDNWQLYKPCTSNHNVNIFIM